MLAFGVKQSLVKEGYQKAKDAGEEAADDFMKGFEKGAKKDE
jgi:hypothetical protein